MKAQPDLAGAQILRTFTRDELLTVFPFGPEALFLDSAQVFSPDSHIHGRGAFRVTMDACRGHFTHHLIMPGHVMVEVASQVAGAILLARYGEKASDGHPYRARFTGCNFHIKGEVAPDEIFTVDVVITNTRAMGRDAATLVFCSATGYCKEKRVFESTNHMLFVTPGLPKAEATSEGTWLPGIIHEHPTVAAAEAEPPTEGTWLPGIVYDEATDGRML